MAEAVKINPFIMRTLGWLHELILFAAIGLGLGTQWYYTKDVIIAVFGILGAIFVAVFCALRYYEVWQGLGRFLFRFWVGLLIGVLAFTNRSELKDASMEKVTGVMFIVSMVLGCIWTSICKTENPKPADVELLTVSECVESLGLMVASLVTGVDGVAVSLFILAYIFHVSAIRLNSYLAMISFIAYFLVGSICFFASLHLNPNIYALICFAGRHSCQSFMDFHLCVLSMVDRWRSFFDKPQCLRKLCVYAKTFLGFAFIIVVGYTACRNKEWYTILLLILIAVMWMLSHIIAHLILLKFMDKITECNAIAHEDCSYNHIMASKGVRHFGLTTQRILYIAVLMTILVSLFGVDSNSPYGLTLTFLVLPVEAAIVSLFRQLGASLTGTCAGFAVISSLTSIRSPSRDSSQIPTDIFGQLQHLFSYHMIQNFGCDFSGSSPTLDNLHHKLREFFGQRSDDGPRFDTYLLYFSGDVDSSGDWALSNNDSLSLALLLRWWREENQNSGSRLILVLDTAYSFKWAKQVANVENSFLAIQTCRYSSQSESVETGERVGVGAFTSAYVLLNIISYKRVVREVAGGLQSLEEDIASLDSLYRKGPVEAMYGISRAWPNFSFPLPTPGEVEKYWRTKLSPVLTKLSPVLTKLSPVLTKLSPVLTKLSPVLIPQLQSTNEHGETEGPHLSLLKRWWRSIKMTYFLPNQLDVGHGLQLINKKNILALVNRRPLLNAD